jgi:hypothetical protein
MVRYITRRLLWAIATLVIVSFVTFVIFYVLPPGDPAVLRAGHLPNPAMLAHIRHVLGVDRPFWAQYIDIGFLLGGAVVVRRRSTSPGSAAWLTTESTRRICRSSRARCSSGPSSS